MSSRHRGPLSDIELHPKFKIAALWVSTMFCYLYGDIFEFFRPGMLAALLAGRTPVGPTTQGALLAFAAMMAIPSLAVSLTLVLKPAISRAMNIVLGAAYTLIIIVTMRGGWTFIIFLGLLEIGLTSLIVWTAWRWPRLPR